MSPARIGLVVLVLGLVALAIYLALRPSQSAAGTTFGSSSSGSTRTGQAITQIGGAVLGAGASIADFAS